MAIDSAFIQALYASRVSDEKYGSVLYNIADTEPQRALGAGDVVYAHYLGYEIGEDGQRIYFDGGCNFGTKLKASNSIGIGSGDFITGFELGLIGKDDRKYDQLKENVAFAQEKYDKSVKDMQTDLENMQEGLYRRDDVDKDFVDRLATNRRHNISKQILGYPAIETSLVDRTDQLQLENRRVYFNTTNAVNQMSLEMTDAQKKEAIAQKTDLMQKHQRQAELTRKEAVYKLDMSAKDVDELKKLENDVTLAQHISESIGGTYKVAPATKVELGAYFAKEKQQPVKETQQAQKVLEKQVEEKTKANDLERE
jgi:hypothetical protein